MKADFLFASLNHNRTIQKNRCQNKEHFMDDIFLKTRGIIYLNVESRFLFAPPIKISGYVPAMLWLLWEIRRSFFRTSLFTLNPDTNKIDSIVLFMTKYCFVF